MTMQVEERQTMDDPAKMPCSEVGSAECAGAVGRADSAQASAPLSENLPVDVVAAYRVCEEIARREARNFYYAFRALPRAKRNAICAVYAFMRHADDISDDETISHQQRRVALDEWLNAWHAADAAFDQQRVKEVRPEVGAVFLALADARRRFGISAELLDELVQGTAMDLERPVSAPSTQSATRPAEPNAGQASAPALDVYPTFDDLYRYCYLVASVVGLVCIRIFGYEDKRAEKLAEETGIAFQLTNILRDVQEDAERGRVYIPVEDMNRFGVVPGDFARIAPGQRLTSEQRGVLAYEAQRAEQY